MNDSNADSFDLSGFKDDSAKPKTPRASKPKAAGEDRPKPYAKGPGDKPAYGGGGGGAARSAGAARFGKPGAAKPYRTSYPSRSPSRTGAKPWDKGPGAGAPPRGGKPWEQRDKTRPDRPPEKTWEKREGAAPPPRSDKPWVKREGGDAPRGDKPWARREGGGAARGGKPWEKREGGGAPRSGAFRGAKPWEKRDRPPMAERPPEKSWEKTVARVSGIVPAPKPISAEIKPFLPLKTEKGRYKESRFILEGAKNIADVLAASPAMLHAVFITGEFQDKALLASLKKNHISVTRVTNDDIQALGDTESPQGILAIADFATLKPDWTSARYVTLMDAVQDPGNVGAVLRTSLALGMDAVVLGKGTCDPYNAKVARASVGALLRLRFETGEEMGSKIAYLRQKDFSIVATSSHAHLTLDQVKLRKKVALIVGNEGAGTSYQDMADAVVQIPIRNKVESLNVAVAHGILSYLLIHGRS